MAASDCESEWTIVSRRRRGSASMCSGNCARDGADWASAGAGSSAWSLAGSEWTLAGASEAADVLSCASSEAGGLPGRPWPQPSSWPSAGASAATMGCGDLASVDGDEWVSAETCARANSIASPGSGLRRRSQSCMPRNPAKCNASATGSSDADDSASLMEPSLADDPADWQFSKGRRRHEFGAGRYGALHGNSGAQICACCVPWKVPLDHELSISRPDPTFVTELDRRYPRQLLGNGSHNGHPRSVTCGLLWNIQEELEAFAEEKVVKKDELKDVITYKVPIIGHRKLRPRRSTMDVGPNPNELYELISADDSKSIRVKKIGSYPTEPPAEAAGLVECRWAALRCPVASATGAASVNRARCRQVGGRNFFAPNPKETATNRRSLEVDLGGTVHIKGVSTSARHIGMVVFPTTEWLSQQKIRRWAGPRYNIPSSREPAFHRERFFPRFELSYRVESGRQWVSLGSFRGPSNNFEEKFCSLKDAPNQNASDGVVARYLRFTPTSFDKSSDRGMKVAVFVVAPAPNLPFKGPPQVVGMSEEAHVTYKLTVSRDPTRRTQAKGKKISYSWMYGEQSKAETRRLLRWEAQGG